MKIQTNCLPYRPNFAHLPSQRGSLNGKRLITLIRSVSESSRDCQHRILGRTIAATGADHAAAYVQAERLGLSQISNGMLAAIIRRKGEVNDLDALLTENLSRLSRGGIVGQFDLMDRFGNAGVPVAATYEACPRIVQSSNYRQLWPRWSSSLDRVGCPTRTVSALQRL